MTISFVLRVSVEAIWDGELTGTVQTVETGHVQGFAGRDALVRALRAELGGPESDR